MPEYSEIETYIICDELNLNKNIEKLKVALCELGFDINYINQSLINLEWKTEDNGFIYSLGDFKSIKLSYQNLELNCRPLLLGWTPEIDLNLKKSWLEISLLYDTEQITLDYRTGKLKNGVREQILNQMKILSKYFNETGTYFTNEATDTKPWKALVGIGGLTWAFDMAIIPSKLVKFYSENPDEFKKEISEDNFIFIRRGV